MGPCSKTTRLHGLRVATGKRGWRTLWLQSSANFRRCSMFVGGWPTCRRGLHGLDDPSWDRLPSGLIGKALGCGRVWTLQQCGRCARLQGKCREARELQVNHQRRDEKQERRAGEPRQSSLAVNFFFCHRRRRLHTLTVSAPSSPSRHGIAVAGWGPRYFPLLLNSISGCDFPWFASLLPRLCGSKADLVRLVNRPQATASDRRAPTV